MDWLPVEWQGSVGKIVIAVAIIIVTLIVWHILKKALDKVAESMQGRRVGLTIFENILRFVVWAWGACSIADICFGIDMAGIIGALGIVGIAVSLGAQQTIANLIGGIIISLSPNLRIGDWVVIQGHKEGRLVDTNWRSTMLEDEDGLIYVVPNSVMISSIVTKGLPFYTIIVPFSLKPATSDVAGLLRDCEQVILDAQIASGTDYEQMRPKAHVEATTVGAIQAEVKLYVDRELDSRSVKRLVLSSLVDFLQERNALAEIELPELA